MENEESALQHPFYLLVYGRAANVSSSALQRVRTIGEIGRVKCENVDAECERGRSHSRAHAITLSASNR